MGPWILNCRRRYKPGDAREFRRAWKACPELLKDPVEPVSIRFLEFDAKLVQYVARGEIQRGPVVRKLLRHGPVVGGRHTEQP